MDSPGGPSRRPAARCRRAPLTRAVLCRWAWSRRNRRARRRGAAESLRAISALVDDLAAAQPDLTLRDVVTELSRTGAGPAPTHGAGRHLVVATRRGLEWDAVFLVGLTDGSLPISQAVNAGFDAIEEERRLFYVGVTRAREHLQVSWALALTRAGERPSLASSPTTSFPTPRRPPGRRPAPVRRPSCRICGLRLVGSAAACSAAANVCQPTSTRNCSPRSNSGAPKSPGRGCAGLHGPERQDAHRDRRTGPGHPQELLKIHGIG